MLVRACRPRPAPPQQRLRYGGAHFASSTAPRRRTITLTDDESNIVSYLNNVNSHFQLGNTIRVVGGWVRNKLLGRDGGDMDIALDKMTGATFCARLREYQVSRGLEQRRIAVIRANPAQSKHLETATTHIFNHSLDFVHLRSEEYDADSRIPRVVFGTPLQDAQRRDFTVNALYYSTGNRLIEDFTERGLDDLEARVLRTPLEPLRTLLDDPLRALRCVRFAGQLSFEPVDELKAALHDQKMQEALRAKVSRERVNVELSKMCLAESYLRAFELLVETGLAGIIYDIGNFNGWQAGLDSLRRVSRMDIQGLTSEQRDAVVNAAFLWPAYQQLNLVPDDVINFFVQSLRGARRRGENVAALLQSTRAALPLTTGSASTRESLASWLRAAPETWQASVLIAAADKDAASVDNLVGELRALNPAGIRGLRPLLNGTEIAELLKLPRGPQIGVAAQALMRWQLANPTAGRQDAVTWLQQRRFYSTPSSHQFASMTASAAPPGRAHHTDRLVENDIGDEPGALFSRWYAEAALNSPPPIEANAMVLCTASKTGQPSSRTVLLREFDQDAVAFTFFGNGKTRKGSEMAENPRASLLFYWPALGRQVRVEGTVERTSAEESAAVFAVRPRDFQVGSCASPDTGKRLESRELLEASARAVSERVKDTDVLDAPPHWTGWRVRADNLEFLQMHPGLLHDRFAFRRTGERSWARERIAP